MVTETMALGVSREILMKAVELVKNGRLLESKPLETETQRINILITTAKESGEKYRQPLSFSLPHSYLPESAEVCFFVADNRANGTNRELMAEHTSKYKEVLAQSGIKRVTKVISMLQIRIEFREKESLKKLASAFDLYVGESKIMRILMTRLGHHFIRKSRKLPVRINSRNYNSDLRELPKEMEKTLKSPVCWLSPHGNLSAFPIGYLSMGDDKLVDNMEAALEQLPTLLPGGRENIVAVNMQFADGGVIAPIYFKFEPTLIENIKIEPRIVKKNFATPDLEDLTTLDGQVVLRPDGTIEVEKSDGSSLQIYSTSGAQKAKPSKKRKAAEEEEVPATKQKTARGRKLKYRRLS